ncbi:hypothetical protein AC623_16225 [Bacillus sp. FJAT-27231]|uniref:SAV0927 family protein n=1 Tax=Bacillus sp. FJAT-27231 TaxID=1679168 RepID=UPI0006710899|nr:SAV0927 family protein [Bacillus sp. FJAT-27231]KMY55289.1 hypothetical protein AC623_16225 [Bacillus sp. FJAT-27231]
MDVTFLMDESEMQSNRFVCLITDHHRYDFAIIDTKQFSGNSIVLSLQNNRMILMCEEDIEDSEYWAPKLGVEQEDTKAIQDFLYTALGKYEPAAIVY